MTVPSKAIVKYRKHPSISAINQVFPNKYFNFSIIEKIDIFDQIVKLKHKIPPNTLTFLSKFWKKTVTFLPNIFTYSLMKQLNHQSVLLRWNKAILRQFLKNSRNQKENYIPVCILPIISKIFQMILSKQLYTVFPLISAWPQTSVAL